MLSTNAFGFGGGNAADDYADNGGRAVIQQSVGFGCTMYRPGNLTANHAVIIWGNGTGSSPSTYASLLRHWASWGFVVVAANTSNAGTGSDMISCLNAVQSSSIGGQLSSQVGTSGHSQGGGGSIMAGRDSRVNATAPIQPYTAGLGHSSSSQSQQQGPMLLLSGSSDFIASPGINQAPVFSRANVPVFWATRSGASHFEPVGDGGDFRGISTAWFLYQLTGDDNAAELFEGNNCGFCNASGWDVERKGF
jgi:hypothetical protein